MIRSGRQINLGFVQTVSSFRFSTKGERRRVEGEEGERERESKFGILVWLSTKFTQIQVKPHLERFNVEFHLNLSDILRSLKKE